jgi:hypothetical protein
MQFVKKHYEKILLGLVLVGLVAAVITLIFLVQTEKENLADARNKIIEQKVKPIPPMDLSSNQAVVRLASSPLVLDLASTNKVFNPVRWLKATDGHLIRVPAGSELEKLEVTRRTILYMTISLESITPSDSGVRYGIVVDQPSAPASKRRKSYFMSVGEKKDVYTLLSIKGTPESPTALVLESSEISDQISVAKGNPYKRVDGYMVDLRYSPENKFFANRRIGDKISIAGEEYTIANITENEVVLSARSNGKKYTIRYNAAP